MQKQSVNVPLAAEDLRALVALASEHCRHPREELRFLLREEARRRGLLSDGAKCEAGERRNEREGVQS